MLGRVWAVIGAIVGIVGAITGVISIWPIITANASGIDDLRLTASPYPANVTEWALPVGTDLSTYPTAGGDGCTDARRAWLAERATQIHRSLLIDMRNVADSGPMLAISDVRIEGERYPHGETAVLVVCDPATIPPQPLEAAMLDASSSSSVAVFSAEAYGIQQKGLPDLPVTWNLAPGETGLVVLRIGSTVGYDGALTVGVVDAGKTAELQVVVDGVDTLVAPALVELGHVQLRAGAALTCVDERDAAAVCDAATVVSGGRGDKASALDEVTRRSFDHRSGEEDPVLSEPAGLTVLSRASFRHTVNRRPCRSCRRTAVRPSC